MARRKKRRKSTESGFHNLYIIIAHSFIGRLAFYAFITLLLVLAALIISGNEFDRFFRITGVGILAITVISWVAYLFTKE